MTTLTEIQKLDFCGAFRFKQNILETVLNRFYSVDNVVMTLESLLASIYEALQINYTFNDFLNSEITKNIMSLHINGEFSMGLHFKRFS